MPAAGLKSFSPTIAACRATTAISAGSFRRSAIRPSTVSSEPPPIQMTANTTWTALNVKYQEDELMKTIATRRNPAAISALGSSDDGAAGRDEAVEVATE